MRYRSEFGERNIYLLMTGTEASVSEKHKITTEQRGYILFGEEMTYSRLASLLSQGAEIRSTKLSEEFDFDDFLIEKGSEAEPLFAINPKGRLYVFVVEEELHPEAGWTLISLYTNPQKVEKKRREMLEED
jgi:hypothetical protein